MRVLDPNRENYKRRYQDGGKCVFCSNEEVLECEKLASRHWRVVVNRFPYMDGNVMIVAARHLESTDELTNDEWVDYGEVLQKVKSLLSKAFKADSFNIGLNIGPDSGASIPHVHWQVIPRKSKNLNSVDVFADIHVVKVTPEETKRRLEAALN